MDLEANQPQIPNLPPEIPADGAVFEDGNIAEATAAAPAARQPDQQHEQQGETEDTGPKPFVDDARNQIFARARERRAAETAEYSGDPNDPNALYGTDVNQDDLGPLEREALQRRKDHLAEITGGQPPANQQQGQQPAARTLNNLDPELLKTRVPIIVDGEAHDISVEDAIREYQINQAADKRLATARLLIQHTQEFNRQRPNQSVDGEHQEPPGQDDPDRGPDDGQRRDGNTSRSRPANVQELAEKIQLGTPEQVADALEEFISSAANRSAPIDDATRVLTALEDQTSRLAVSAFAEKNPQLVSNPILSQAATREIHKNMAEDLLKAGYSMDQLRELAPGPKELTQLHKHARIQKMNGVRPVDQVLSAAYQGALGTLRSTLEQLAPAGAAPNQVPSMQQRQQRKESLQPQPVVRRLSPTSQANAPARTQEQGRSAAVERMRKARGQSV